MEPINVVKYKSVDGTIYDTMESAIRQDTIYKLGAIIGKEYFHSMNISDIANMIWEYKDSIIPILNGD